MKYLSLLTLLPVVVSGYTRGVSFFGFETSAKAVHMLWCNPLQFHINKIAEIGFNTIRVPISEDLIMSDWDNTYPQEGIINPNYPEAHMKSIEVLDYLFDLTAGKNISILFDIHRLNTDSQAPKPFLDNTVYTFVRFMDAWVKLLDRYHTRWNLMGIDPFNEYQSDDWNDWSNLAAITINHIEAKFPDRFNYYVEGDRWGGDLSGVKNKPVNISANVNPRVFYSVHKYWFSDQGCVWDQNCLIQSWNFSFGYLGDRVMVGEWGYISSDNWQTQWANWFVDYLKTRNIHDTYFWSWNFDSGDTKGVLLEDCNNVNQDKVELLHRLWY